MADILFGDANPGGKLPITIPRSVGQLPLTPTRSRAPTAATCSIRRIRFPFGFGLSYTTRDRRAEALRHADSQGWLVTAAIVGGAQHSKVPGMSR